MKQLELFAVVDCKLESYGTVVDLHNMYSQVLDDGTYCVVGMPTLLDDGCEKWDSSLLLRRLD